MISPSKMSVIQIETTNACIHSCSNCTRFCGLHKKTFMMDLPTFKKAIDSLKEYNGIVGIMGGEPTLNPNFKEIAKYASISRSGGRKASNFMRPVKSFNEFHGRYFNSEAYCKTGLWSALGSRYYENLELITDSFPYQCLNDHKNSGLHQALLLPRKELNIPDDQWYLLRDKCWIQNNWSASITPKGAFFCEIAAALDMLFDGPGGWPIEKDWWKRTPEEFGEQLNWCELCSAPLAVPQTQGKDEIDTISPEIFERLKASNPPKIKNNKYRILDTPKYNPENYALNYSGEPYLSSDDKRISQDTSSSLFPQQISIYSSLGELIFDGFTNISSQNASQLNFSDWLLVIDDVNIDLEKLCCNIKSYIFNLGGLYYVPNKFYFINRRARALENSSEIPLDINQLKKLYPRKRRYLWKNWNNPDSFLLSYSIKYYWGRLLYRFKYKWNFLKKDNTST